MVNFAFPSVTLFCIFRHSSIVSLATRLPDTDEFELVEKSENIEREVVAYHGAYKELQAEPDQDRYDDG